MKFQTASPILLKSVRLLALAGSICLFEIYFAMNFNKSLMFFASDTMCLMDLWCDIG